MYTHTMNTHYHQQSLSKQSCLYCMNAISWLKSGVALTFLKMNLAVKLPSAIKEKVVCLSCCTFDLWDISHQWTWTILPSELAWFILMSHFWLPSLGIHLVLLRAGPMWPTWTSLWNCVDGVGLLLTQAVLLHCLRTKK